MDRSVRQSDERAVQARRSGLPRRQPERHVCGTVALRGAAGISAARRTFRSRRARRCTFPTPRLSARCSISAQARGGETVLIHGASGGCRHCRRAAGAGGRTSCDRHGGNRPRTQAGRSTKAHIRCSTTKRPDISTRRSRLTGGPRLRRDPRNAGQRESGARPRRFWRATDA